MKGTEFYKHYAPSGVNSLIICLRFDFVGLP